MSRTNEIFAHMCNKQRVKTREDLKFTNLTEAGSSSWSRNRGCKSTWCVLRPRRRWLRALCSSLPRISRCHLSESDFDQDGLSSDQVFLLFRNVTSEWFWSGWSDQDSLIRCYYHDSDDKVVLLTDVTGLWQGCFFCLILSSSGDHRFTISM